MTLVSYSTSACAWGWGVGGGVITTFVSHSLGESFCACVCSGKGVVRWHNLCESFGMSTLREGRALFERVSPHLCLPGGGGGGALLL